MPLNEADTRAQLVEPKLQAAGWTGSQITREHLYRRDHRYTAGRIYLIGDDARRREPRRVDYLLRYTDAFPIAVVEYLDGVQTQVTELKRLQTESATELERLSGVVLARAFRGEL